ncbi:MAG: hypothetical protein MJ166_02225 [Clostridia bacterium]|nr:hypothetical protein [Clostridia bacterium]
MFYDKELISSKYSEVSRIHNVMVLVGNGFDISVLSKFQDDEWKGKTTSYRDFFDYITDNKLIENIKNKKKAKGAKNKLTITEYADADEAEFTIFNAKHKEDRVINEGLFVDKNLIYEFMCNLKDKGIKYWADFEGIIDIFLSGLVKKDKDYTELISADNSVIRRINEAQEAHNKLYLSKSDIYRSALYSKLENDVEEMQKCLAEFLQNVVSLSVMESLNEYAMNNRSAIRSLGNIARDVKGNCQFLKRVNHYNLYEFLFVNFNYTYLLDNYIYADRYQFDPHKFKTVDRNFEFIIPSNGPTDSIYSSYLLTDVIHPHGVQNIPRSMLIGTERGDYDGYSSEKRFIKSFWAQANVKYIDTIKDAELYIIFGMSMGKTDGWWLSNIYQSILNDTYNDGVDGPYAKELIIYQHCSGEADEKFTKETKKRFLDACSLITEDEKNKFEEKVAPHIFVVPIKNGESNFLGLKELD